jgi:hypothetical protein
VRGYKADIDFSFWDIFDSGSSGAELESLAALMGRSGHGTDARQTQGGVRIQIQ